jgi:hypothetical protein
MSQGMTMSRMTNSETGNGLDAVVTISKESPVRERGLSESS